MGLRYLVIEGNIGAGKTCLCKKIADKHQAKIILEQYEDNPFLPKFYQDPKRYAFPLELSFLADRYNQLKTKLDNFDLFSELLIADYFFMKSLIFASETLLDDEYKLYRQLFNIIYNSVPKPDLYVYLHRNIENLKLNIKQRGREYEQDISEDYLKKIEKGYFSFFYQQQQNIKILICDVNNIDFINDDNSFRELENAIFNVKYDYGITRLIL